MFDPFWWEGGLGIYVCRESNKLGTVTGRVVFAPRRGGRVSLLGEGNLLERKDTFDAIIVDVGCSQWTVKAYRRFKILVVVKLY